MEVHILAKEHSVFNQFLAEIRDKQIQVDPLRFRRNLERMGEVFAYEISKTLRYEEKIVQTPLGEALVNTNVEQPVLATILRAGLPLHQGLLSYFDHGRNAFISAYRKHDEKGEFDIHIEYIASPSIDDSTLILSDPMLATGQSMVLSYKAMLSKGQPERTHIVAVLASEEGLEYTKKNLPENTIIWLGDVDKELTSKAYISPGLGDAGDLAFGEKS
ncbi:MAG TPA: uracil phosphoribosyltransferase [Flavobacteriales bacterium]|nr:uracil phosphoribosyltransferase [Flavobacteriales bacterium]HIN38809.1 uracil phosphoribosyltransferase [Flavobacteriales bacterium]